MARRPRAPPGRPVVGNVLRFARDPLRYLDAVRDAYRDPLLRLAGPNGDVYVVRSPELVRRVLVEDQARYAKADLRPELTEPFLGDGLLTAEGAAWADQRRRLNPAFSARKLREYADSIRAHAARLADDWRAVPDRDVHADMTDVAVRVIGETLLGTRFTDGDVAAVAESMDELAGTFRPSVSRAVLPRWVPRSRPDRFDRAVGRLDALADRVVENHRVPDPPDDVVTTLLAARDAGAIGADRVRDEVVTFLLAGHETTALVLTYAWFLLSGDASTTRLRAEVDALGDAPGWADLGSLRYTEAVVNESMRLYPPVWALFREPRVDARLGDYRVPEGTPLLCSQWVTHRDGQYWADPRSFRPERWADRPPAETPAFFPFGAGPRACIARGFALVEAKLVLAALAREFDVAVHDDELPLEVGITIRPAGPVRGTVRPR